jgi:hypothetical protein
VALTADLQVYGKHGAFVHMLVATRSG